MSSNNGVLRLTYSLITAGMFVWCSHAASQVLAQAQPQSPQSGAPSGSPPPSAGAPATPETQKPAGLSPIFVEGRGPRYNAQTRYAHTLPEVDGPTLTVTKKTTVTNLGDNPTVIDNNLRELFARLPGLLIAEQQNPLQLNLTYRGIGNPQESEYVLSLQDGIPIPLNWVAYPTQYYLPVPQTIGSIQLIRAGSSMLYGPQPQPVINYISRRPTADRSIAGTTEQVGGSNGLFSSFNRVDGTTGAFGYLADYVHRSSDGERDNGRYVLNAGDVLLEYKLDSKQKIELAFHTYSISSGLAGFQTLTQFNTNPSFASTPADHEWTDRTSGVLTYENAFSDRALVVAKLWTGSSELTTRADTYAPGTTNPTAAQIDHQQFRFTGGDVRLLQRWGRGNALTVGVTGYRSDDPWNQYNSSDPYVGHDDSSGQHFYSADRKLTYGAAFVENVFRFGAFHLVPSARFEHEDVDVHEQVAAGHPTSLVSKSYKRNTPLFGIGLGNDFGKGNETYLNVSQSYRPVRYRDVINPRSALGVTNDPDVTKYLTYEAGVHGWPATGLYYDVSIFQVNIKNRIESQSSGVGQSVNVNSGNARNRGLEAELAYDLLRVFDATQSTRHLDAFVNFSLLDSKIVSSQTRRVPSDPNSPTLSGNRLAYAPRYLVKAGVTWRADDLFKLSLVGLTVGEQYWADSNLGNANTPAVVPKYTVFDISGEYRIMPNVRLLGGVSNLSDRHYYSRVFFVNGGIEPANGRTFHAGAAIDF